MSVSLEAAVGVVLLAVLFEVGFLCGRRELRVRVRRVERAWESRHCGELHALHGAIDSLPSYGSAAAPLVLQDSVFDLVDELLDALEEPS